MRVLLVSRVQLNPYVRLLAAGLEANGASCRLAPAVSPRSVLAARLNGLDVIHLHWLELLYESPDRYRSAWRLITLLLALGLARALGIRVVYTVHNVVHHERRFANLNGWGNRILFRLAGAVHVHDRESARQIAADFGRETGVYVVPHGNYVGAYPNRCTTGEARRHLGLADAGVVYLFLGGVRPYKGVEVLLQAFKEVADERARLLIAGHSHHPRYAAEIAALARSDPRVVLRLEHVPDDELQYYFNASTACIFPYRKATTSGAALLALSFGCPIVAPNIGPFPDLVDSGRGVLYGREPWPDLVDALKAAQKLDPAATREACLAYASSLEWPRLAAQHLATYRGLADRVPGVAPPNANNAHKSSAP